MGPVVGSCLELDPNTRDNQFRKRCSYKVNDQLAFGSTAKPSIIVGTHKSSNWLYHDPQRKEKGTEDPIMDCGK